MSPHKALCSPEINIAGTKEAGCTLVSSSNATAINADDALQIRLAYRPHPGSAAKSFGCFPKLPPKVRQMIWSLALTQPRLIEIYYPPGSGKHFKPGRPIALLSTCKESRDVALEAYHLVQFNWLYETPFYFSPDYDVLFVNDQLRILSEWHLLEEDFDDPLEAWEDFRQSVPFLAIDPFALIDGFDPRPPYSRFEKGPWLALAHHIAEELFQQAKRFCNLDEVIILSSEDNRESVVHVEEYLTGMRGRDWMDRRREDVSWREGEQFHQVEKEKVDEDEKEGCLDEPVKWYGGESDGILQDPPTITHLTYECMEGETPVAARRRAVLSYLA